MTSSFFRRGRVKYSLRNWWLRRKWWHWGGRGQNITKNGDVIYGRPVSPYTANDGLLPDLVVHTSSEKKGQPAWANVHKYVLGYSRPFERWLVPVTTSHPHSYVSRLWHEGTYIQWGTGSIRKFHRLAKIWWLKCDAMQRYADAATAHKSLDSWVADYRNKWSWDPNCHRPQTLDIFSGLAPNSKEPPTF